MNKAFVREPDDTGQAHCPACGSLAVGVGRQTWQAHVDQEHQTSLAEAAFFCPFAKCEVVYFDMFERRVTTDALLHPVYPKDPAAPICGCFGLTTADIDADIAEGSVRRTRALIEKAKSPEARCTTMSASGRSCVSEVQGYYMKQRGQT
jgi:hypothetical protein